MPTPDLCGQMDESANSAGSATRNVTAADQHQVVDAILQYFAWGHLPAGLQQVSRPIGELAVTMADTLPLGPELAAGLRKLLEAKDCLVRAALDRD